MEISVPYHPGLLLGRSVDMKTMQPGYMIIGEDINSTELRVGLVTSQFSFVHNLRDVCDILKLPLEYALKVKAGIIENTMVDVCLRTLQRNDSFSVLIRTTFLQQKEYLPPDIVPSFSEFTDEHSMESLIAHAAADSDLSMHDGNAVKSVTFHEKRNHHKGTHWVKAVEIGDELVTVMTIFSKDIEKLNSLRMKLAQCLQSSRGQLNSAIMEALHKVAVAIDKKLSKKHNEDVVLDIKYCSFTKLDRYPASMAGMVKTIEGFMDLCACWAERSKHDTECETEVCIMKCNPGIDREEKLSVKGTVMQTLTNFVQGSSAVPSGDSSTPETTHSTVLDTDVDGESFVVLDTKARFFYSLRVTLQSFLGETETDVADSFSSLALNQYPETTYTVFENLFNLYINCLKAEFIMQDFLSSQRFLIENRFEDANHVLKSVQYVHLAVEDAITSLDFVCMPAGSTIENLTTANPLSTVKLFIENITSKLPPGNDVDLLMIGKTGHGKSSTGNSILGQNKFISSADEESVTCKTGVGWAEIDDRTIKVVDTPGVCDTNLDGDSSSIDHAIKSISQAIANCPEGFHALLLIIRFGIRMTNEEKKAIGLLKCVLGEDIVKSHCVCIITYGDNFETEMAGKKTTFETWCRNRSGFLKDLFTECNYRCVLFNNKATDPKVKKAQLIQLINKVDSLKASGTRYTNSLFEFAQRERRRIISQGQVPQINEDMVRDIQLILEYLNNLINTIKADKEYRNELQKLKERVDDLSNRVSETDNGQLSNLVDTVFALSAAIHSRMDDMANNPTAGVPNESQSTATEQVKATGEESSVDNQDLLLYRGELQRYYDDEISPMESIVTEQVTEQVKCEVKKENECFPGSSMVTLANGRSITLDELCIGDKVLVRGKAGHLIHDTVYMFGHQEPEAFTEFIVMSTASHTVHVTAGHYIYCVKQGQEVCVAAKNVSVGDCLLVSTDDGLMHQPVKTITYQRKKGLFAPFTNSGSIIVDQALMSCYVDVLPPSVCHTLLMPIRQIYRLSPRAVAYINGSSLQYPVPRWAVTAMKLL